MLVKIGGFTFSKVASLDINVAEGGKVLLINILLGFSTTSLVDPAPGGKA
jgi:D-beta-D-heptose 7-phosphate kinase/D-beta-D-heptose 1-phosphate adenosyltransferase